MLEIIEGSGDRSRRHSLNQAFLRQEATEWILDAQVLLDGGRWSHAYYVAGYAVECALKSCLLARMVYTGWVFQEKARIEDVRTHEFEKLIQLAGLTDELITNQQSSAAAGGGFVANWQIATQWKVTSRYESRTEVEARQLYDAIIQAPDGVLPWVQQYW